MFIVIIFTWMMGMLYVQWSGKFTACSQLLILKQIQLSVLQAVDGEGASLKEFIEELNLKLKKWLINSLGDHVGYILAHGQAQRQG